MHDGRSRGAARSVPRSAASAPNLTATPLPQHGMANAHDSHLHATRTPIHLCPGPSLDTHQRVAALTAATGSATITSALARPRPVGAWHPVASSGNSPREGAARKELPRRRVETMAPRQRAVYTARGSKGHPMRRQTAPRACPTARADTCCNGFCNDAATHAPTYASPRSLG